MYTTGSYRLQERKITPQKQCPNSTTNIYTSQDGLTFDLYYSQNFLSNSLGWAPHTNVGACMEQCSTYKSTRCYGVSYDTQNGNCTFKGQRDVSLDVITSDVKFNSAIARATQLDSLNITCPFPPNSYQYTTEGQQFEVLCELDMPYGDYRPSNVDYAPYHANSLQECMEFCSTSRPLCVGVAWNPDMINGFANCCPKNSQVGTPVATTKYVTHSALWRNDQLNVSCPTDTFYPASNDGKSFEISCNSGRLEGSNTSYHATTLDDCINTCATNSSSNCLGAVYDGSLQGGFLNCYLLNATGEPTSIANSTFALFTSSNQSTTHKSQAYIAGPVIGGIAVISLLVGFVLWRRRKRPTKTEENVAYQQVMQSPHRVGHALHELHNSSSNTPKLAAGLKPQLNDPRNNATELAMDLRSQPRQKLFDQHIDAHELG